MKKLSIIIFLFVLAIGCAKERPIEKLQNPEKTWQSKDAFTGINTPDTWLYKTTVIKTSNNQGFAFVGLEGATKAGYFDFKKEKLKFYDATDSFKKSENNLPTLINQWNISHHDVMLEEKEGKVANVEIEDNRKTWDEKRYFSVDFSSANVSEAADFPYSVGVAKTYSCWKKKSSHLVDDSLDVESNYISFVVAIDYELNALCNDDLLRELKKDFSYSVQYRYSFKKIDLEEKNTSIRYTDGEFSSLDKKFGFFKTIRTKYNKNKGQFENEFLLNKWRSNKIHNYYFAKGFPIKWKWIFNDPKKGIFSKVNKLFEDNGIKTRFYVRENTWGNGKEKKVGDIRYSLINIVTEKDPGAPLGYGPSNANPFTGEIVSGNITLWTSSLKYQLKILQEIEESKKSLKSGIFVEMERFLETDKLDSLSNSLITKNKDTVFTFHKILKSNTYALPRWNSFTTGDRNLSKPTGKSTHTQVTNVMKSLGKVDLADQLQDIIENEYNKNKIYEHSKNTKAHLPNHNCLYSLENATSGVSAKLLSKKGQEEVMGDLLYSAAIHEFGHTLNLRHNFYGSVDSKNFEKSKKGRVAVSSSVMDYLALEDEAAATIGWGPYDKAALLYAYSNGTINQYDENQFLYCTDEHRPLNSMCGAWDKGDTPSKVVLDKIRKYEKMYFIRNYRNDRAFWDTSSYISTVIRTMYDLKAFLSLWRDSFTEEKIDKAFSTTSMKPYDQKKFVNDMRQEMINVTKLTMAFYQGVLQLSSSERDWKSSYDEFTGAKQRIGILYDKVFALRFLIGDDAITNDPGKPTRELSYLSFTNFVRLSPFIEKAFENTLTKKIAMDNWFQDYAHALYAVNSMSRVNRYDVSLINKIKIVRFSSIDMENYFGITPGHELRVKLMTLVKSKHSDFEAGTDVGILELNGSFYMANKEISPISYSAIVDVKNKLDEEEINEDKYEILQLHNLYKYLTSGFL